MIKKLLVLLVPLFVGSVAVAGDEGGRTLEDRWNTALVRTIDVDETFVFFEGEPEKNIIRYFVWDRCEEAYSAGAHPTLRGGTSSAYAVATRILANLNSEIPEGKKKYTLDDLLVECNQ